MKMKKEQTIQSNFILKEGSGRMPIEGEIFNGDKAEEFIKALKEKGLIVGTKGELDDTKELKEMFYTPKESWEKKLEEYESRKQFPVEGLEGISYSFSNERPIIQKYLTINCTLNKENIRDKKFQVVYDNNIYYTETNKFTFMEFPINGEDLISLINRSLSKVDLTNVIDIKFEIK